MKPMPHTHTHSMHGPDNAEHELRKAYNCIIESGVNYTFTPLQTLEFSPQEAIQTYEQAFQFYRQGKRLTAERWARAAKHLARAFWHEAKIAYLEPRLEDLPYLKGAQDDEYHLHERLDSTAELLASIQTHPPLGHTSFPKAMAQYISRAQHHLSQIQNAGINPHELLRAERIKAAYEYSRVIECMNLGYEALETTEKSAA
jgi:hypothetical protein